MEDSATPIIENHAVGSVNYSAPEMVLHQKATVQSDIFSLGVIAYEMLAGQRPFKDKSNSSKRPSGLVDWQYEGLHLKRLDVPRWVDAALQTACATSSGSRYSVMSEFLEDLKRPGTKARQLETSVALLERNPVAFWKGLSGVLFIAIIILISLMFQGG